MIEINSNFIIDSKTSDHYQTAFSAVSVLQGLKIHKYKRKSDKRQYGDYLYDGII